MAKFKDFIPPKATVYRNGEQRQLDAVNLVPGDIIHVSDGNKIPADIRIVAKEIRVNNSSLTVSKFINLVRERLNHNQEARAIKKKSYWKQKTWHFSEPSVLEAQPKD